MILNIQSTFELTNHLGNVLAVVSDRKIAVEDQGNSGTVEYYEADVVSAQDYYPFGMLQPGRSVSAGEYRYGLHGMEMDNDWSGDGNHYTTEFRQYDPRVGRWMSLDPAMRKYASLSPYNFNFNNPVYWDDPDGDDPNRMYDDPGSGTGSPQERQQPLPERNRGVYDRSSNPGSVALSIANDAALKTSSSILFVGSSISMPIINAGYGVATGGDPRISSDRLDWAKPYSLEKGWNLKGHDHLMDRRPTFDEGRELLTSTLDVISLGIPLKNAIGSGNHALNLALSFGIKSGAKKSFDLGLDLLESSTGNSHTVESGDTLSGLSKRYGVSVDEIATKNNIENRDHIEAGQELNF